MTIKLISQVIPAREIEYNEMKDPCYSIDAFNKIYALVDDD